MTIEAMKQALKAHKKNERHRTVAETRYWCDQYKLLAEQAIAAIAEAEKQEPVAWMHPSDEGYDSAFRDHSTVRACTGNKWEGWIPLYTTPPAAQEEPIEWLTGCPECGMDSGCDCESGTWNPPKRQWVGLTLEQKQHLNEVLNLQGRFPIIDAIEAMLKEKNA